MTIFLAIVMGPGFTFMLYALYQFWREEWRMRHGRSARRGRIVTFVTARSPLNDQTPHLATRAAAAISEDEPAVVRFAAAGETPARAKVVTTYLKNRVAAIPSQTGRLAVKRAAKG
jgi:hypothetical protein